MLNETHAGVRVPKTSTEDVVSKYVDLGDAGFAIVTYKETASINVKPNSTTVALVTVSPTTPPTFNKSESLLNVSKSSASFVLVNTTKLNDLAQKQHLERNAN